MPASIHTNTRSPSVRLNLWSGGRIEADAERAEALTQSSEYQEALTRDDVALLAAEAYVNWARSLAMFELANKNFDSLRITLNDIQKIVDVDTGRRIDLEQAQVRMDNAALSKLQRQTELHQARQRLSRFWQGSLPTKPVGLSEAVGPTGRLGVVPQTIDQVMDAVSDELPAIAQQKAQVQAAEAAVSMARGQYWPTVDLTSTRQLNPIVTGFTTTYKEDTFTQVQLNMPLYNGGATSAGIRTAAQDDRVSLEQLQGLSRDEVLVVKLPPKRSDQTLAPMQGAAFSWFWGTLWRFRHFYVESMVATVVANILTLASVFFTMNVYDRVVPTQAYASLWTLAIGTTVAIVMEFIMRWLKARLVDLGGKKADLAINATLLREVMGIRLENRPQSVGTFASSMRDFESLRDFFSSASLVVLADMPFVLLFLALIAMVSGPLAWIPGLAVPVLLIQGLWAQKPLMTAMRANMKESGDKQSVLVESVLNLELLKAHNAENYLQRRWEASNKAGSDSYKEIRAITNWIMGCTTAVTQLVTVFMVVAGVYMIHANMLTLGGLIASVILAGRALGPLGGVMSLASRYQQAASALETLDGLMKRPRDRIAGRTYVVPEHIAGGLEAQALEFGYPGEHAIPVIKRLSIKIEPGQHVALLGRVGSGKSTLLRLMAGLYTPLGGSVRLDGVELQQIEPAEVRSCMGYVGQDPQLFMGTLRENMVLSETWISDTKIIEVLKSLNLYEMVAAHPRGLDMPITEAGGGLSGGQRQLLSIGRMMLRDPQLVYMDEPTANMDGNTEAHVIAVLKAWLKGRTLLMSTHRPQLLEWADVVAVIEAGQCVMVGPKQEMIEKLSRGIDVKTAGASA